MAAGGGNEPNLTPFIDLFSVLVCFLLMTAAWIQLEVIPTNMEKATAAEPSPDTPPPSDEKKVKLYVDVAESQVVMREDDHGVVIPNREGAIDDDSVKRALAEWKVRFPDRKDVVLNTEAKVQYGQMIKMYDLLISSDFSEVGINPM